METMERVLKLATPNGIVDVPVRISSPVRLAGSWQCHWEIRWPANTRNNSAGGVDAVQAMFHALQMVGIELYSSREHREGRLQWAGAEGGYGFPLMRNLRDLLVGQDAECF